MNLNNFIAGSYESQRVYRSFLPTKIHHPWLIADVQVQDLLGYADRALGELNAYVQIIPDINLFIKLCVLKEATQSSKIEGTQTNIEDALKPVDHIALDERGDWGEVQNYIQAMNYAIEQLDTLPFCNRLLKDTHAVLLPGVRGEHKLPGEFRTSQNWIGVSLKNADFVPPHSIHVVDLMSDMELFLNDEKYLVPPLIKIAIAHYQLETIHPFLDGNGRLGRLMIPLYLASKKLLTKPALYMSDYFESNKTAYIDHLIAVRQGNHLREWLIFFLHGIEETARSSIHAFKATLELKSRIEKEILPRFGPRRDRARLLVQHLYRCPVVDIKSIASQLETTPNTAMTLINDFVKQGVLKETTGRKRNRLFVFEDYLELFRS